MSLKKIQCLNELFAKLNCRVEILQFLKDEKIINDDVMATILNELHLQHPNLVFNLLEELQQAEKVQLVDYQWNLLPKEFIQLTIVTDNAKREFTYAV